MSCNKVIINMEVIFTQRQHRKTGSKYGMYLFEAVNTKNILYLSSTRFTSNSDYFREKLKRNFKRDFKNI